MKKIRILFLLFLSSYATVFPCTVLLKNDVLFATTVYASYTDLGSVVIVNFGQHFPFDVGIDPSSTISIPFKPPYDLYVYERQPAMVQGMLFKRVFKVTPVNCTATGTWPLLYSQLKQSATIPVQYFKVLSY